MSPTGGARLFCAVALACGCALAGAAPAWAAPGWLAPVDLSAPFRDAGKAGVAMDEAGHAVAVWHRQEAVSSRLGVQVSIREPGSGFSGPVDLSSHSQDPVVAMTPSGEAIVAWWHFENPPGAYVLETSTRLPGGSFSPAQQVTSLPKGAQASDIRIAVNQSGDAVLAWAGREPEGPFPGVNFVEASVRSAGGGFSDPEVLSPPPSFKAEDALSPSAAIDAAGEAVVVWEYSEVEAEEEVEPGKFEVLGETMIQAAARPPGGEFSTPQRLSEEGNAFAPEVAMDSAGDAVALWLREEGEELTLQAAAASAGGPFAAPGDLSTPGTGSFSPHVEMTPSGTATAVWVQSDEGVEAIEASTRPLGGEFAGPEEISSPGEEPVFPALAIDPSGDALVSWSAVAGSGQIARAVTRTAGGGFSSPVDVSAARPECCFHPDAAIGQAGDATLVWTTSNGSNTIAQAAGYDALAPELRGLSIPATGTVGVPVGFSVDPFDRWAIASTSFDFGDGSGAPGASVAHAYSSPGTYRVTATAVDAAGTPTQADGTISIRASSDFRLVKVRRKKRSGAAVVVVDVPGPGRLTLSGKGGKRARRAAAGAGPVTLPVKPDRRTLKRLKRRHRARVRISITFAPTGGDPATQRSTVTLIEKPTKKR